MAVRLEMFIGLPGSGKTTEAKRRILDSPNSIKRVNKDDLRAMLDAGHWSKGNEKFVLQVRDDIIRKALLDGKHVISDDTNLHPKHVVNLEKLAKECDAQFHINRSFLDVSLEECIRRDLTRMNSVGKDVIMSMYNQFLKPPPVIYTPPEDSPPAIIVDIDGTLAHFNGRSPYDETRVSEDLVDETIANLVRVLHSQYTIILFSGRSTKCMVDTERWLASNYIPYNSLYMRAEGDNRKDSVIKKELFDQYVRDLFNVKFVLDDRNQVVEMWRNEIGLKVLQVADGDF